MKVQKNQPLPKDTRTKQQQLDDREIVQQLTQKNINTFNIKITEFEDGNESIEDKKNISILKKESQDKNDFIQKVLNYSRQKEKLNSKQNWFGQKKKLDFGQGTYIYYYDNYEPYIKYEIELPLLIISGFPTFIFEWKRLLTQFPKNFVRIVHFVLPGLDQEDERRGWYRGYAEQISDLIKLFLDTLGIQKVINGVHSFGTVLQGLFYRKYPEYIVSTFQLGAPTIIPHDTLVELYQQVLQGLGTNHENFPYVQEQMKQFVDTDDFRNMVQQKQKLPKHIINENMIFIKLIASTPKGLDIEDTMVNLPQKPRFIGSGDQDIYINKTLSELNILHFRNKNKFVLKHNVKESFIRKCQENSITKNNINFKTFDFENVQSNFSFMFQHTGHSVQKRRSQELYVPLTAFIIMSNEMWQDEKRNQYRPKL